jgi:outer membrane lipoprotein-sorting protein
MMKRFLTFVMSMLLCIAALAASDARSSGSTGSAEQWVRDSTLALSKLHSYELNVISSQAINDGQYIRTFHNYVETSFAQSGGRKRIRMVSRKAADTMTIVSDGSSGYWIYHESDHRYQHRTGSLPAEVYRSTTPGFSGTLSAENLPAAMQSAEVVRQEMVPLEERQEPCDVVLVHLKPNMAPPDYRVQNNQVTLWLSHEYRIPMKLSATFIHQEKDGKLQAMDMTILVQKFHPNVELPESTWIFQPPPDAQPETSTRK